MSEAVDRNLAAHVGKLGAQRCGDPAEARVDKRLVRAELGSEAVEGVDV
jgi:hypothetical protein